MPLLWSPGLRVSPPSPALSRGRVHCPLFPCICLAVPPFLASLPLRIPCVFPCFPRHCPFMFFFCPVMSYHFLVMAPFISFQLLLPVTSACCRPACPGICPHVSVIAASCPVHSLFTSHFRVSTVLPHGCPTHGGFAA